MGLMNENDNKMLNAARVAVLELIRNPEFGIAWVQEVAEVEGLTNEPMIPGNLFSGPKVSDVVGELEEKIDEVLSEVAAELAERWGIGS